VLDFVDALGRSDEKRIGGLLEASHESLKVLYEVSCRELDLMVDIAMSTRGVVGARMTGAGFGGCAVALVREAAVQDFVGQVSRIYRAQTGIEAQVYVCQAAEGASLLAA